MPAEGAYEDLGDVFLRSQPCARVCPLGAGESHLPQCSRDDPSSAWRPELGSVEVDTTGQKVKSPQPWCAFRHGAVLGPSPRAVTVHMFSCD